MKKRKHKLEPRTPEAWQSAVDAAEALLHIDAARQYGLIEGGPVANVERAAEILEKGRRRGITPSPGCVERFIFEWQASCEEKEAMRAAPEMI